MDTFLLIVFLVVVGTIVLKRTKPELYKSLKERVLNLLKNKW